jgi:IS5 family transposase
VLGIWYRLSDVELAQALFRNMSFRAFCHLEWGDEVPNVNHIWRFRARLMDHGLWRVLRREMNRQLEAKHIFMTEGSISIIDVNFG